MEASPGHPAPRDWRDDDDLGMLNHLAEQAGPAALGFSGMRRQSEAMGYGSRQAHACQRGAPRFSWVSAGRDRVVDAGSNTRIHKNDVTG